jgi:hypothetical protein
MTRNECAFSDFRREASRGIGVEYDVICEVYGDGRRERAPLDGTASTLQLVKEGTLP